MIRISVAGHALVARLEDELSPRTVAFFRTMLRNSVPAHLYFGLGTDSLVTSETVHMDAAAFDDDEPVSLPETPESAV